MPTASRPWLRASEVAARLHVSPKTVTRWANQGRLAHRRTLGGHRRYDPEQVDQLVRNSTYQPKPTRQPGHEPGRPSRTRTHPRPHERTP